MDITLPLEGSDGGFRLAGATPEASRMLDPVAWEAVVERAAAVPKSAPLRLMVTVPPGDLARATALGTAIRRHFARRREAAEYELDRTRKAGWMSLLIGLALLVLLMSLGEAVGRIGAPGHLRDVIQEGLTIVGWVALWRPVELLLYDPWVLRRDIALYRRLENADVSVTPGA
ncbi:MAG TPA: hypothetical protein VFH82_09300 [Gemmatimonadota bacterium]|jgi:hypothetical protein|nr:hypothetical protein [Gemmatimonadota bacterium]